jgi:hypothetical protein
MPPENVIRQIIGPSRKTDLFQNFVDFLFSLLTAQLIETGKEQQVLAGCQVGIDRQILRHHAQPLSTLRNPAVEYFSFQSDFSGVWFQQPQIIIIVVDLPAPFGPSKPKASPAFTEKLSPSTALRLP